MYAKLFASLYQGTLRGCSDEILVFTNLIAHADSTGMVDKHFRAIAEETGLDIERVKAAIANLEAPDPESRSPEMEGRRIVKLDEHRVWGWQIVNHGKYRAIRSEEDRREQNRIAQAKWREKRKLDNNISKQSKPPSAEHKQKKPRKPKSAQAEAEAEAYTEAEEERREAASPRVSVALSNESTPEVQELRNQESVKPVEQIFAYWQIKTNHLKARLTPERRRAIKDRLANYSVSDIQAAIDGCLKSPYHMGINDKNTVYDDIELICRNDTKLEKFIALADTNKNGSITPGTRKANLSTAEVLEQIGATPG